MPSNPPDHLAVIPARWNSTRFPGKPLALLDGRPLFWHVHQRCLKAKLLIGAIVATDDPRIGKACEEYDVPYVLTGTDRVAEAAQQITAAGYINVQGDEPFIDPDAIDAVSYTLSHNPLRADAVNACTPIDRPEDAENPNVVKAVVGDDLTDQNYINAHCEPAASAREGPQTAVCGPSRAVFQGRHSRVIPAVGPGPGVSMAGGSHRRRTDEVRRVCDSSCLATARRLVLAGRAVAGAGGYEKLRSVVAWLCRAKWASPVMPS